MLVKTVKTKIYPNSDSRITKTLNYNHQMIIDSIPHLMYKTFINGIDNKIDIIFGFYLYPTADKYIGYLSDFYFNYDINHNLTTITCDITLYVTHKNKSYNDYLLFLDYIDGDDDYIDGFCLYPHFDYGSNKITKFYLIYDKQNLTV